MPEEVKITPRVKIDINTNAKGLVQFGITVETNSVEETMESLNKAYTEFKDFCVKNQIKLAEA